MTPLTRLKLALVVVGLLLFFGGVRLEQPVLRGAGIAAVAVAFLLRFVKPRAAPAPPTPDERR
jgi:hypothetical protein